MLQKSNLGSLFATVGLIGGIWYSVKHKKDIKIIALIAVAAGLGGYVAGNAISKFYQL